MQITAQAAGGEIDEDYSIFEAGFSEGPDGSGLAMMFQRELSEEPWNGDPQSDDYFSNSYCITLGSGEAIYGGLKQVSFAGSRRKFDFSDHVADVLGIGRQLLVDFEVSEQGLQLFQKFLKKIVTWGVPSQISQIYGFN